MVITEIKHLNVRISHFEDNIFDKNILPIFTTPLILKEVDARKKSKYKIETLNPEKKLTFKIVSFNKIVEELAARINKIAINLEPHYFIDPTYFNSLPYNVRQDLDKKNLIDETKEIKEALLRVKRSTVKNKKLLLYQRNPNYSLASRLLRNQGNFGLDDAQLRTVKGIAASQRSHRSQRSQRNLYNSPKSKEETQGQVGWAYSTPARSHRQIGNKEHGANIKTMSLFRNYNNILLLKNKDILKYRVETLINFKNFFLASLLKEQSTIQKIKSSTPIKEKVVRLSNNLVFNNNKRRADGLPLPSLGTAIFNAAKPYLPIVSATFISGWIPTSKGALMLLEDEGWDLNLLSNINKTGTTSQRLKEIRPYSLRKLRRLRRLRRLRLMSISLYSHRSKNVNIIQKDQITQGRNHSKLYKYNEYLIKHNDNKLNFIINWIGDNLTLPSTQGCVAAPTHFSSSYLLSRPMPVQRLDKKNISEIFLAQNSKPVQLSPFELGVADNDNENNNDNPNLYTSKSANSSTLPFYSNPKKGVADLHLRKVSKEGNQSTMLFTANNTRQQTQGGTLDRYSLLTKVQDRSKNAKNRKFSTLGVAALSNYNISNVNKIVLLNTLILYRAKSNVADKGHDRGKLSGSKDSGNNKSFNFKNNYPKISKSANAKKATISQGKLNLLKINSALRASNIENKKTAFSSETNYYLKKLGLTEPETLERLKKINLVDELLLKTSENIAKWLLRSKKINAYAYKENSTLTRNIKHNLTPRLKENTSESSLVLNLKLKILKKIKSTWEGAYFPWKEPRKASIKKFKSKSRLFWAIIKLYSSLFNPMLKSLNKGLVNSAIKLRLLGLSDYSGAQIKKIKKTAYTLQTITDPSVLNLKKGTAVLNATQQTHPGQAGRAGKAYASPASQYGSEGSGLNFKQENKSLPLHTVNLLLYQLKRKLETISQPNFSKGNTTRRSKQKGGTKINALQLERIAKIKEQIFRLSSRVRVGIEQSSKSKQGKLGLLTQGPVTSAQHSLKFKKGSKINLDRALFKQIDNILASSAKLKIQNTLTVLPSEQSTAFHSNLDIRAQTKERNNDNKIFLFLYFILPIFFATLKFISGATHLNSQQRKQIILNQKKQLHSLIKLMLDAGSVIRNKKEINLLSDRSSVTFSNIGKKVNLFSGQNEVDQSDYVRDVADLLKWSILFISHSLAPLKRKQEYYSLIIIKVLEAKGILVPKKDRSKLKAKSSSVFQTNLERLAARYHGSLVLPSKPSKEELISLISNSNPDFKLGLLNSTTQNKKEVNKFETEVTLKNSGTSQAVISNNNTLNSSKIVQDKYPLLLKVLLGLVGPKPAIPLNIENLRVLKEAQASKGNRFENQTSLKIKTNNTHNQPKINKVEVDKPLLQTDLKKASITFYPGGRFLSDWKRVTKVIWQEELKFKAIYSRVNNSLYHAKNNIFKKLVFWYAIIKIFRLWNIIKILSIKSVYSFKLQTFFLKFGLPFSIFDLATLNKEGVSVSNLSVKLINLRLNTLAFKAIEFKEKIFNMKKKANKSTLLKERKVKIAYLQIKAKLSYQIRGIFKRPNGFNYLKFKISKIYLSSITAAHKARAGRAGLGVTASPAITLFNYSPYSIINLMSSNTLSKAQDTNNEDLKTVMPNVQYGQTITMSDAVVNSKLGGAGKIEAKKGEVELWINERNIWESGQHLSLLKANAYAINQVNILDKIKYPILEIILKNLEQMPTKRFSLTRSSILPNLENWTLDKKLGFISKEIKLAKTFSLTKSSYATPSIIMQNSRIYDNKGSLAIAKATKVSKPAKAEQAISKENLPKQIAGQMIHSLKLNTELKKSFNNLVFAKSTIIGKIRSIKLIELIDKMKEDIIIAEKLAALERVADITNLNLINKKQFRRINTTKYLNNKNIYRSNRIKILQTIKTIKTDLRFEHKLDSNSLSIIPVSLLYYSNLKDTPKSKMQSKKKAIDLNTAVPHVFKNSILAEHAEHAEHTEHLLQKVNSPVAYAEIEKPPVLNAYLRELSTYNRETKGTIKYFSKFIAYNFNTNTNKISNNIYDLLAASFKAMRCLISKPVFVITPDKITIQLFYFLLVASKPRLKKVKKRLKYRKNNRLRLRKIYKKARLYLAKNFDLFSLNKLFSKQFDLLCNILNKEFNKPVEFNLTRLHYPSGDSNILVNLVGLIIHKVRTQRIFNKIFAGSIIKTLIKLKARKFNDISIIPAFLTGLNIKIAGRLMTQPMRPRKTINQIRRGASASGKINYLNFARLTKKNKRGSFSITISAGQNYFK